MLEKVTVNRFKIVAAVLLWLSLVVSSLIVGYTAFHYLGKEEERIRQLEQQAITQRLDAVETDLALVLGEIRLGLEDGLRGITPHAPEHVMDRWVEENPFVSARFRVGPAGALMVHPEVDAALVQALRDGLPLPSLRDQQPMKARAEGAPRSSFGAGLPSSSVESPRSISQRQAIRDVQQRTNAIASSVREESAAMAPLPPPHPDDSARRPRPPPAPVADVFELAEDLRPIEWIWINTPAPVLVGYTFHEHRGAARGVIADMGAVFRQLQAALPADELFSLSSSPNIDYGERVSVRALTAVPGLFLVYSPLAGHDSEFRFGLFVSLMLGLLTIATVLAATLLLLHSLASMKQARQRTGFVSTVSHEFKTPLTTIRMYSEMLREGRVNNPERRTAYLGTIENETERLSRMVGNVLNFSRVERGVGINYNLQQLDLAALVSTLVNEQRPRIEQAGMELQVVVPPDPVVVTVDRDSICQILLNLMDNAVRYAASGGWLHIHLESTRNEVQLLVEDRGPGISKRRRQHLFKPFQRTDRAITDTRGGCGLGLSISRQIARDHGGNLELVPLEPGSRFVLTLPKEQPL